VNVKKPVNSTLVSNDYNKIDGISQVSSALLTFRTKFFAVEDCLVHYRMFGRIPGLYSLDAGSTYPVVIIQGVPRHYQMSPGRAKSLPVQNH